MPPPVECAHRIRKFVRRQNHFRMLATEAFERLNAARDGIFRKTVHVDKLVFPENHAYVLTVVRRESAGRTTILALNERREARLELGDLRRKRPPRAGCLCRAVM